MKIASFNVENLFERVKAMNEPPATARDILNDYAKLNSLLARPTYSSADKASILALLKKYKLQKAGESEFFLLRENRGHLFQRETASKPAAITAGGRGDWIGWLELKPAPVNAVAISNTGRVISDLNADVLAVVEAEDRPSLMRFNKIVLAEYPDAPYYHVMLIDGNDERGIDVGIMTRESYPITSIESHVDDHDGNERIFSRDCAGYRIDLPSGKQVWILINHLKSKGYGDFAKSNEKRKKQAQRVRDIYDTLVQTDPFVAVVGDFNDTPDSDPLDPLLGNGSTLKDVSSHPGFDDGGRPGTYANGAASNKIDYILCSPKLFEKITGGGIYRMGVWGGKNGDLFPHYDTITGPEEAASDHAAIWGEFDL
ncbi:MAG: endonuclease/exonuclease/phosphatase family protein [Burkholderiales bacterium]